MQRQESRISPDPFIRNAMQKRTMSEVDRATDDYEDERTSFNPNLRIVEIKNIANDTVNRKLIVFAIILVLILLTIILSAYFIHKKKYSNIMDMLDKISKNTIGTDDWSSNIPATMVPSDASGTNTITIDGVTTTSTF